ncbi:MAG: DegV family protein [Methylocystaceae bacterium]
MPTTIITDSTAYLPLSAINNLDIGVVSLNMVYSDHQCRELDLDFDQFYADLPAINNLPTTSQPAPAEVLSCFDHYLQQGHDIVGIFISSLISGTFETIYSVTSGLQERYPGARIELIDSKMTAMALGYPVMEAASWAREGMEAAMIAAKIRQMLPHMRLYFIPITLEYLRRGGRIGNISATLGGILDILPVLHLNRGVVELFKPARGRKAAINRICSSLEQDRQRIGVDKVFVVHASAPDTAGELAELIKERFGMDAELYPIGPVVGVHAGPGALGIVYHLNDQLD